MMKSLPAFEEQIGTQSRGQMIEITDRVRRLVTRERVREGMVIVYVWHTTACVAFWPSEVRHA
jgi:thiamine phosphate synthase YjbQ (UPF0047 family)